MAANRLRAGKEIQPDQLDRLQELRLRLESNAEARARLLERDGGIRQKYEAERVRYRELIITDEEEAAP